MTALVIEEVRYDFNDRTRYADDFVRDLTRLMVIAKLNASARNPTSKNYFLSLMSQIEGCEAYVVKYGQPLLYVKYRGMEFTDQKVTSQFVRSGENVIDVTMESVFGDFVKCFDSLASTSESKVKWGVTSEKDRPDPIFALLNAFVDAVSKLSSLPPIGQESLAGKRFGVRNASISRKSLHLEVLVDGQLNILELNPTKKPRHKAVSLLFGRSDIAQTIVALMKQS